MTTLARAGPLLVALGLLVAAPANAVYVETPLRLAASDANPDVGDAVDLTISAGNESAAQRFAGADVLVRYSYDASPSGAAEDPDAPTSDEGTRQGDVGQVRLDERASGSLAWTVPEEVRDENVFLVVLSEEGETLASLHLAVGEAEPVMFATGGVDDGREVDPVPEAATEREAPAAGALLAVAALGALALRRR